MKNKRGQMRPGINQMKSNSSNVSNLVKKKSKWWIWALIILLLIIIAIVIYFSISGGETGPLTDSNIPKPPSLP